MKKIRKIIKDLTKEYKKAVKKADLEVCRELESEIAAYDSILDELE